MGNAIDLASLPEKLRDNPFFHFSEDTNFVPSWDKIKPEHVVPAMEYALEVARKNIKKARDSKEDPSFENAVEIFETSGELSNYILGTLWNIIPNSEKEGEAYHKISEKVSEPYSLFFNKIFQDKKLYKRLKAVAERSDYKSLSQEQKYLYEMYESTFVQAGINLPEKKQNELTELDHKIAVLSEKAQYNMSRAASETILIKNKKHLKGLSKSALKAARKCAKDVGYKKGWAFDLSAHSYGGFMQACNDRCSREKMWHAYHTQASHGPYNNRKVIVELMASQQKRARLSGYKNLAESTLEENMAGTPKTVSDFLENIRKISKPIAEQELQDISDFAMKRDGIETIEPWDLEYYEERLKKEVLGFDENELAEYLEVNQVMQGMFTHFENIFGIEFRKNDSYPVYHEDVLPYDVYKAGTDEHMGTLFFDLYDRKHKPIGIAWDCNVLPQGLFYGEERRPIDILVCKFSKGEKGQLTFLSHYDVWTLVHEMGHATHNLMSQCRYPSLSGYNTQGDFVELPSQLNENWIFEPEVMDSYARHYETGEPLPDEIKETLSQSRQFGGGQRALSSALLAKIDQEWARVNPNRLKDITKFEERIAKPFRLLSHYDDQIAPRFSHGFGGGYEALYYSYEWTRRMDADIFDRIKQTGDLYDKKLTTAFRKALEKGGSEYGTMLFKSITGKPVRVIPHLERQGLLHPVFNSAAVIAAMQENANDNSEDHAVCFRRKNSGRKRHLSPENF